MPRAGAMKGAMRLCDVDELPREKFVARGAGACSDADLLAILMHTGNADESVLELARRILNDCCGSLANLQRMSLKELMQYKGVGQAKALVIKAAAELMQRRLDESFDRQAQLTSSALLFKYFERCKHLSSLTHEESYALYLNKLNHPVRLCLIGRGGLSEVSTDVRLVLRGAIESDATRVALCHNHPSGSCKPSASDNQLTWKLYQACQMMDILLIDHIIVAGHNKYYSYCDENRLCP